MVPRDDARNVRINRLGARRFHHGRAIRREDGKICKPANWSPPDIAGAVGEWTYYVLGSAVEVALLAAIVYYAWNWPKEASPTSTTGRAAP